MLMSALSALGEERFSFSVQLRILAKAFLIAIFFTYYKTILMTFDYCVDSLCSFNVDAAAHVPEQEAPVSTQGNPILKFLLDGFREVMVLMTHRRSVKFMHYIKSVALLVLSTIGPFAALFSLLPGPFKTSFRTWSRGYLNVSCWTIILTIIDTLATSFSNYSRGPEAFQGLLSFVMFIATFFTPTWTAKLISGINLGNLAAGVGTATGKMGSAIGSVGTSAWRGTINLKDRFSNKRN
ncbi:MAG: hypothetical protein ACX93T_04335 [Bacteroidota bacterium]